MNQHYVFNMQQNHNNLPTFIYTFWFYIFALNANIFCYIFVPYCNIKLHLSDKYILFINLFINFCSL